jgi:hypothetical protein
MTDNTRLQYCSINSVIKKFYIAGPSGCVAVSIGEEREKYWKNVNIVLVLASVRSSDLMDATSFDISQQNPSFGLDSSYCTKTTTEATTIGLHHPLDGVTNPECKLLHFIQLTKLVCKNKMALAFNLDRCCHLALCVQVILFHLQLFLPFTHFHKLSCFWHAFSLG